MNINDLKRELAEAIEGIDEVLIEQEADWLFDELKHAVLDLEPAQGRQHVQNLLREMREKFNWEAQESGVSIEEERLLAAYDFALTVPMENYRERHQKTSEHLTERDAGTPELSDIEQMFLLTMDWALYERSGEQEASDQRASDNFEQWKERARLEEEQEAAPDTPADESEPEEPEERPDYRKLAEETKGSGFKREK